MVSAGEGAGLIERWSAQSSCSHLGIFRPQPQPSLTANRPIRPGAGAAEQAERYERGPARSRVLGVRRWEAGLRVYLSTASGSFATAATGAPVGIDRLPTTGPRRG
jgi:hypothetical protein